MTASTALVFVAIAGLAAALGVAIRQIAQLRKRLQTVTDRTQSLEGAALDTAVNLNRLEAAATAAPFGIVIADEFGAQLMANPAASAYTSTPADDGVVPIRMREVLEETTASSKAVEHDIQVFSPEARTIRLSAAPLMDGTDHFGSALFISDFTDRSQVESIRRDFIANASHELKTPLGAMRLLAEALTATSDETTRAGLADRIQSEASRMNRLIEDILDLAVVEEGRQPISEIDLRDVVAEACQQTRLLAETLGISVENHGGEALVSGDRRQLISALANLIENALIYTEAKGLSEPLPVVVTIRTDEGLALIDVVDQGIGIPARHLDRVFERFYRVDRGRSRESGGTGLGLAIVRHVVENHDGTVTVESTAGEGTSFRIALPLREE